VQDLDRDQTDVQQERAVLADGEPADAWKDTDEAFPAARSARLLTEPVGDELVVYDLDRDAVHLLNPVAASIWKHCDGRTTVAELAAALSDELELPANDDVVMLALNELQKSHLLEQTQSASMTRRSFSRRQAVKRLAATAGIGLILPAIESLNPPSARAAASQAPDPCAKKNCEELSNANGIQRCGSRGSECKGGGCTCKSIQYKFLQRKPECLCTQAPEGSECGRKISRTEIRCDTGCPSGACIETTEEHGFIRCVCK
jgi:Coenzyme PQQ synthesis protein D (PqqD)